MKFLFKKKERNEVYKIIHVNKIVYDKNKYLCTE